MINYPEGIFLGIEAPYSDMATAKYAILPIGYEGTVSYMKGTADGPAAIIAASPQMEWFDEELKFEFYKAGITTAEAVQPANDPAEQDKRIFDAACKLCEMDKFILALGGEHSISGPLVRAATKKHGPISVLQVDAHADLRDSYDGSPYSHAAVMSRILEVTDTICQVGIRSFSAEEYAAHGNRIDSAITPQMIRTDTNWTDRAIELLGGENTPVYITIDIDGLDPSIAPGTGTPEPGGLSWDDITTLIKKVANNCNLIGADIVEVRPLKDNPMTEFLAARLAAKIIAYHQYYLK